MTFKECISTDFETSEDDEHSVYPPEATLAGNVMVGVAPQPEAVSPHPDERLRHGQASSSYIISGTNYDAVDTVSIILTYLYTLSITLIN